MTTTPKPPVNPNAKPLVNGIKEPLSFVEPAVEGKLSSNAGDKNLIAAIKLKYQLYKYDNYEDLVKKAATVSEEEIPTDLETICELFYSNKVALPLEILVTCDPYADTPNATENNAILVKVMRKYGHTVSDFYKPLHERNGIPASFQDYNPQSKVDPNETVIKRH